MLESIVRMEPMLPAEGGSRALSDLVLNLVAKSNALAGQMEGLLASDTPKSPVRLAFPFKVVERWFPALYPDDH